MWLYSYGFGSTVRSNGGPCFKETFTNELDKLGVKHILSSAHNPQSNGGAERVCKSIREVLDKRGGHRTDQLELSELCFKVNSHIQPGGICSAHERFHRMSQNTPPRSNNAKPCRTPGHDQEENEIQVNLSLKKGRVSVDEFMVNDRVLMQNNING